jgi:hypothetical protein
VRVKDFIRRLFDKRGDLSVLPGQLADPGRREHPLVELQKVDLEGRDLLSGFQVPEGAAERLAQKIATPEFWVQLHFRNSGARSPAQRLPKLSLNFDVVGHQRVGHKAHGPNEKVNSPQEKDGKKGSKRKNKRQKPTARQ